MSARGRPPLPELIRDFEAGSITPGGFDHETHVRVAWEYLERFDVPETLARYSAALTRLTEQLGIPDKYHATITGFLILLIAERRETRPGDDWPRFRTANPDLFRGVRRLMRQHYAAARLDSPLARRQFLLPDGGPDSRAGGPTDAG